MLILSSPVGVRRAISTLVCAALLVQSLPSATLRAQSAIMTRVEYEACQARDETAFRQAIEGLTIKGLQIGLAKVDYETIVADAWKSASMDDISDRQVDGTISQVSEENSYWAKATSLFSKEKAQELATTVADRVFKSEQVKRGIEALGGSVGVTLGKNIELAAADTAEPAMQCLQAFLGPRYGSTIARVVSRDAGKEYALDTRANTGVTTGQVLTENAGGLAGAIILIVRRQLANMAGRVGARMVGAVLSRLVSVVAGGVGVVLIAKGYMGSQKRRASDHRHRNEIGRNQNVVQAELATAMKEQIGENMKEIAAKTAERVLEVWSDFRRAHAKVLELADKNSDFKRFLERLKPEALPRLDETVAIMLATEGEAGILKRLADGSLNTIVNVLPDGAFDIARETRSIDVALQWTTLAGENLPQVLTYEIHRRTKPETLTKASLIQLLAVGDKLAVGRLASLAPNQRTPLFELPPAELRNLARSLVETDLGELSRYITALDKGAATRLLSAVSQTPSRMQLLGRPSVRDAILASKDQSAAVGMMLRSDVVPDPWMVAEHARYVLDGKVSPWLLWEKHPIFVGGAAFLGLALLAMMKRMLFGRRPRVVVERIPQSAPPPPRASAPPIRSSGQQNQKPSRPT